MTKNRVERGPAVLPGIVADPRKLLMTVDGHDGFIHIQDGVPTQGREYRPTVAILDFEKARAAGTTEAPEKRTQGVSVRIPGQSRQVPEHIIVSEGPGETQPLLDQDNRIEHSQHSLADLVAVIAPPKTQRPCQKTAQNKLAEKVDEF